MFKQNNNIRVNLCFALLKVCLPVYLTYCGCTFAFVFVFSNLLCTGYSSWLLTKIITHPIHYFWKCIACILKNYFLIQALKCVFRCRRCNVFSSHISLASLPISSYFSYNTWWKNISLQVTCNYLFYYNHKKGTCD